jgi:hypothetical protein
MKIQNFYFFWIVISIIIISSCEEDNIYEDTSEIKDEDNYCPLLNIYAPEIDIDENDTIDYNYKVNFITTTTTCETCENIVKAYISINPLNENKLLFSNYGPYFGGKYGDTIHFANTDTLYWNSDNKVIRGYPLFNNVWKKEDSLLVQHGYIPVMIKKNKDFHCGWLELSVIFNECTFNFFIVDKYLNNNPNEFCLTGIKNNSE